MKTRKSLISPSDANVSSQTTELQTIALEMAGNSDRACVLLCGAMLDQALEELLRHHFRKTSGAGEDAINDLLTRRPLPPLGSFTVRAKIAYLMGLIDGGLCKSLMKFTNIRNEFAHKAVPPPLTTELLAPVFATLPKSIKDLTEKFRTIFEMTPSKSLSRSRTELLHVLNALSMGIHFSQEKLRDK